MFYDVLWELGKVLVFLGFKYFEYECWYGLGEWWQLGELFIDGVCSFCELVFVEVLFQQYLEFVFVVFCGLLL